MAVVFKTMDYDGKDSVRKWIDEVYSIKQLSPSTQKTSQKSDEFESYLSAVSDLARQRYKPRGRASDMTSTSSVVSFDNIAFSDFSNRSRQRPSCAGRVKASLATASPKIVFVHETANPENDAAKELLEYLNGDDDDVWEPDASTVKEIWDASRKCVDEICSEDSWIIEVAQPLLRLATRDLPLECWNIQTEFVLPQYQPRYTVRDSCSRKLDLVVGLPPEKWQVEYDSFALQGQDQEFSHISHPHTGKRFLGAGFEVKPSDGNLIEAEVQLGIWMAGLKLWMWTHRNGTEYPPPVVACITIGVLWEFYIIYGTGETPSDLKVYIWGPLSDLAGRTGTEMRTKSLLKTLRRVMKYTRSNYAQQLFKVINVENTLEGLTSTI